LSLSETSSASLEFLHRWSPPARKGGRLQIRRTFAVVSIRGYFASTNPDRRPSDGINDGQSGAARDQPKRDDQAVALAICSRGRSPEQSPGNLGRLRRRNTSACPRANRATTERGGVSGNARTKPGQYPETTETRPQENAAELSMLSPDFRLRLELSRWIVARLPDPDNCELLTCL
jgi:hypothetical protein